MLKRVVTGVLAGAVALAAVLWSEPYGLAALMGLALTGAAWEAGKLSPNDDRAVSLISALTVFVAAAFMMVPSFLASFLVAFWVVGNIMYFVRFPNGRTRFLAYAWWIPATVFAAAALQRQFVGDQAPFVPNLLLLAMLPLWVGDSLAYFVGKAIGKHKLAPAVSPNKTWEGAIANLLGCLGAAYGIGAWLGVPVAASLVVGLTTGILGQIGDLLQSHLKRSSGVKDSGGLLPGHGGLLDRLDSLVYSCTPSFLALYTLAPDLFHVKRWPL